MSQAAEGPGCAPTPAGERRACVRYACDLRSLCQLLAAGHSTLWFARVLNVSARGLALAFAHPVEPGVLLEVGVEGPGGKYRSLVARVVQCSPQGPHEWVAGCELTQELGCAELLELLV